MTLWSHSRSSLHRDRTPHATTYYPGPSTAVEPDDSSSGKADSMQNCSSKADLPWHYAGRALHRRGAGSNAHQDQLRALCQYRRRQEIRSIYSSMLERRGSHDYSLGQPQGLVCQSSVPRCLPPLATGSRQASVWRLIITTRAADASGSARKPARLHPLQRQHRARESKDVNL